MHHGVRIKHRNITRPTAYTTSLQLTEQLHVAVGRSPAQKEYISCGAKCTQSMMRSGVNKTRCRARGRFGGKARFRDEFAFYGIGCGSVLLLHARLCNYFQPRTFVGGIRIILSASGGKIVEAASFPVYLTLLPIDNTSIEYTYNLQ